MKILKSLDDLDGLYDAILCDAWGVIHNGIAAYEAATNVLSRTHERGVPVLILTNAPRTYDQLSKHFQDMGIDPSIYDDIISSGEVGRDILLMSDIRKCYHLGPKIDEELLNMLDFRIIANPAEAEIIFNSGLRDNTVERSSDYQNLMETLYHSNLSMICVNPDKTVHVGLQQRECAGKLAEIFENLGGKVTWVGKPYPHIYERSEAALGQIRNRSIDTGRILAIGDTLHTDIKGAAKRGYKTLFVTNGIHKNEICLGSNLEKNIQSLLNIFNIYDTYPDYIINYLC